MQDYVLTRGDLYKRGPKVHAKMELRVIFSGDFKSHSRSVHQKKLPLGRWQAGSPGSWLTEFFNVAWDHFAHTINDEEASEPSSGGKQKSIVGRTISWISAVFPDPLCPNSSMMKRYQSYMGTSFYSSSQTALQAAAKCAMKKTCSRLSGRRVFLPVFLSTTPSSNFFATQAT